MIFCATRSLADRDLGLRLISVSEGLNGFLVIILKVIEPESTNSG